MKFDDLYNKLELCSIITNKKQVIEEKDHRKKMVGFGIPQDVADFLHNFNDKYSLWFADKIAKMPGFQNSNNKVNFVNNLRTGMQGIVDWVRNTPNILLKDYDWDGAIAAADQYHTNMTTSSIEGIETNTVIKTYKDGFYWVDLESKQDSCEASAMGHCASTSKGDTLYSLRKFEKSTNTVEPFITISISPDDGVWYQCKGKKNSKPKSVYHPYIADILIQGETFKYDTEYDSGNDFTNVDLKNYINENSDDYPNSDEILAKIEEHLIGYDDFEKVFNDYQKYFKHYTIYLDSDTDNDIYIMMSFYIEIDYEDVGLSKSQVDEGFEMKYNSPARKYLNDILDVYVTDVTVEESYNDASSFIIRADIEDSDNSFAYSKEGLKAFEQQCELYKGYNKDFDEEEFIEKHVPNMLELDGVTTSELSTFITEVKKYTKKLKYEQARKSLDITISSPELNIGATENALSIFSIFGRMDGILSDDNVKECMNKSEIYGDVLIYILFWKYIKKHILHDFNNLDIKKQYNTFTLCVKYDADEQEKYDFEKELDHLIRLDKSIKLIQTYLTQVEHKIISPYVHKRVPITIDDVDVIATNNTSSSIYTKYGDRYVGSVYNNSPSTAITNDAVQDVLDSKNNLFFYTKVDIRDINNQLEEVIGGQMSFKNFFEGFIADKNVDVVEESFTDYLKNPKVLVAAALLLGITDYNYTFPKLKELVSQKVNQSSPEQIQQIQKEIPQKLQTPLIDRILNKINSFSVQQPKKTIITSGPPKKSINSFVSNAMNYIRKHEGVRNVMYRDIYGNRTIGIGHLVKPEEIKKFSGKTLTEKEIEAIFNDDVKNKLTLIRKHFGKVFDTYSDNMKTAILDGYFRGDLSGSPKTRLLLKSRKFPQAAKAYLDNREYESAKDAGSGVAKRMEANAKIFASEG